LNGKDVREGISAPSDIMSFQMFTIGAIAWLLDDCTNVNHIIKRAGS